MKLLDQCVDALESAIAERGVSTVDVREFAPQGSLDSPNDQAGIIVELLRVWMEHQWNNGVQLTTKDCLALFPNVVFTPAQIEELKSEETRQAAIAGSWKSGETMDQELLSHLPTAGEVWLDFELITELGRGASAIVYLAKQRDLANRWVALKLTNRQSFESHWLASLQHTAIVPIYSTHHQDGIYGICMPYLGNTTLADILSVHRTRLTQRKASPWFRRKIADQATIPLSVDSTVFHRHARISTYIAPETSRNPSLHSSTNNTQISNAQLETNVSPSSRSVSALAANAMTDVTAGDYVSRITRIGFSIAQALQYAHELGIVHSDIKPANILLGCDGQARLLDFNVAYNQHNANPTQASGPQQNTPQLPLGGTFAYMAPELKRELSGTSNDPSAPIDGRIDIYSFGILLYELLHGRLPAKQQTDSPTSLLAWSADVSPALQAIIRKCINPIPSLRYASTKQLVDDLEAHCESRPLVHQPEPSLAERAYKWTQRHPRLSSLLSVSSVAFCLLLLAALIGWRQFERHQQLDWSNRIEQVANQLPETMSLVSAMKLAPELNEDALAKVNRLLDTVSYTDNASSTRLWNTRWNTKDTDTQRVYSSVNALLWMIDKQDWQQTPLLPPHDPSALDPDEQNRWAMLQRGEYATAIPLFELALQQNPHDFYAWWLLGDCYLANGNFRDADQAYSICIAMHPKLAIAYFLRGNARMGEERFAGAIDDFRQAAELKPKWPQSHFNRAVCLHNLQKNQEALAELELARADGLESVSLYRLQGDIYAAINDSEKSTQAYQLAIQLTPKTEGEALDRGLLLLEVNPKDAEADFLTALKLNPQSNEARQKLAYVYSELLGDVDRSLVQLSKLIKQQPDQPTHQAAKAVLLARSKRGEEAETELRQLEQRTISEGIVAYQIACAYSLLAGQIPNASEQNKNRALFWLVQSTSSDPTLVPIILTDPDSAWLREQPEFKQWLEAIRLVHPHLFAAAAIESSP